MTSIVINPGPFSLTEIDRYDDIGVEGALEQNERQLSSVRFRLVEIAIAEISETKYVASKPWNVWHEIATAVREGSYPPIIVVSYPSGGFGMLDGMNRLMAHVAAGRQRIRAYEVIEAERQ